MLVQFVLSQETGLGHFTHVSKLPPSSPCCLFFLSPLAHLTSFFRLAIPISWGPRADKDRNTMHTPHPHHPSLFSLFSLSQRPPIFSVFLYQPAFLPLHQNATVPIHSVEGTIGRNAIPDKRFFRGSTSCSKRAQTPGDGIV
ncbi:uncharacterized protein TrAtP1_001873 [Trichoderma atroviride]|uniref:uncharacterized protein n=1 Tax=Hypocrea atroviridis TaxID=63577 RepID=UPI00331A1652|nr:hypothetical protein TrAtP1_001873 [Trichoderma atroviride]